MRRRLRILLPFVCSLFFSTLLYSQVTTNGGSGLAATYPTLEAAITALNTATITSPVTITLSASNPQTAPAGGYEIKAEGSIANPITIVGNNNTITASAALTAGSLTDAIFKIIGGDYITIDGFSLTENAANTTTTAASNNMTEWGIALLYSSITNGSQNNTITNCTIDLNKTYQNTFGIYSNSNHTATVPTTAAPPTAGTTTGGNHGLKITKCNITDVNLGICVVGPTTAGSENDGLIIGGTATDANSITNYGTTGTFSGYANVSGTVYGIVVRCVKNFTISYNTITSSDGGTTSGTLRGIYCQAPSNAVTGTVVDIISNNTLSVKSGVLAGVVQGIFVETLTANNTTTLNIENNNIIALTHTVAGATGAIIGINTTAPALVTNINNNTFTNLTSISTGSYYLISGSVTMPVGGSRTINNNSIVTGFSKTGDGGTFAGYYTGSSSPSGTTETQTGNNFSNITVVGATIIELWRNRDGVGTANGPVKTVTNNTFNNITGGTGQILGMIFNASAGGSIFSNNTISNINSGGIIIGANMLSNENGIFQNNTISALSSTGANAVSGIVLSGPGASCSPNVYKNKIYNIQSTNSGGSVNGVLISYAGTGVVSNIANNLIGDLKATAANSDVTDVIRGISITSTSTVANYNIYYNTIYINATSTGAHFATSGVYHVQNTTSTTAVLEMKNNIIINTSTASGLGNTAAYRRSTTGYDNYSNVSNNNLFYAGTPSATNLIFTNGTDNFQTLAAFKTAVATRETASQTENVAFASTTGTSSSYLHLSTSVVSVADGGATPIPSFTDDFDGNARNASTPDIGADEYSVVTPVSLLSFNGIAKKLQNILTWATATENNNNGFYLERSADGKNFSSIYFVQTKAINGNSNSTINYDFKDKLSTNTSFYYRLKQVDVDGKTSYSKVILLKAQDIDKFEIVNLYPNPASSVATINITSSESRKVSISIIDMNGRTMQLNSYKLNNGENSLQLNVNNLAKGNYIIKVISIEDNAILQTRLVKQ